MGIISIFVIGIALAMDALGVSLSVGVNPDISRELKIAYVVSFGFFQFLLLFVGGVLGNYINTHIVPISDTLGGIVIFVIGVLMIIDGFKAKEETILAKKIMVLVLGISVSIDAIVIGFTVFHSISSITLLFVDSLLVGLITSLICTIGLYSCRYIRKIKFISKYADFFGGLALMLFSIKMILF